MYTVEELDEAARRCMHQVNQRSSIMTRLTSTRGRAATVCSTMGAPPRVVPGAASTVAADADWTGASQMTSHDHTSQIVQSTLQAPWSTPTHLSSRRDSGQNLGNGLRDSGGRSGTGGGHRQGAEGGFCAAIIFSTKFLTSPLQSHHWFIIWKNSKMLYGSSVSSLIYLMKRFKNVVRGFRVITDVLYEKSQKMLCGGSETSLIYWVTVIQKRMIVAAQIPDIETRDHRSAGNRPPPPQPLHPQAYIFT